MRYHSACADCPILRSKKLPLGFENTRLSADSRAQKCQIFSGLSRMPVKLGGPRTRLFSRSLCACGILAFFLQVADPRQMKVRITRNTVPTYGIERYSPRMREFRRSALDCGRKTSTRSRRGVQSACAAKVMIHEDKSILAFSLSRARHSTSSLREDEERAET